MRFFVILFLFILTACSQNIGLSENHVSSSSELPNQTVAVNTNKKMQKIEGGSYLGFIGKDSARLVEVSSFYLDESPVTNAEFLEFLRKNPQWTRSNVTSLYADDTYLKNWVSDYEFPGDVNPNAPITNISWFAAHAYAESVGKRLPTIDEWEFAALADETSRNASDKPEFTAYILNAYQNKSVYKKSVKQKEPNFYGIYDLYGVIWEWTEDFNSVMISGESRNDSATNESLFCSGAAVTTSDLKNYAAFMRYAMRGSLKANYSINNLGFRCAKDL
ncbi:MAG: formylglycine-generating enzyme family protein [Weeksellaceae bacterium]|nr:formylglycine-generating enzyme family protein [Weeksellaceae bacterium]